MASRKVLDASAFYAGMPFLAGSTSEFVTTPAVIDEVAHINRASGRIDALLDCKALVVSDPDDSHLQSVARASRTTGDAARLSKADMSVLGLALQTQGVLVSDDYAVANVAHALGIKVEHSLGKKLSEPRKWISYCAGCGRSFGPEIKVCPNCGNMVRRKYRKMRSDKFPLAGGRTPNASRPQ